MAFPLTLIVDGQNKGTHNVKRVCDQSTYDMVSKMLGTLMWYIYGEDISNDGVTWYIHVTA